MASCWPFLQNESLFRGENTQPGQLESSKLATMNVAPEFPMDCSLLCSTWPLPTALATRLTSSHHWPISRSREMLRQITFGAAQSHESENLIRFPCLPNTTLHVVPQANRWALSLGHFRWSSGGPGSGSLPGRRRGKRSRKRSQGLRTKQEHFQSAYSLQSTFILISFQVLHCPRKLTQKWVCFWNPFFS